MDILGLIYERSKFILLTESGKVYTFATLKIIAIMTYSANADVSAVP